MSVTGDIAATNAAIARAQQAYRACKYASAYAQALATLMAAYQAQAAGDHAAAQALASDCVYVCSTHPSDALTRTTVAPGDARGIVPGTITPRHRSHKYTEPSRYPRAYPTSRVPTHYTHPAWR